MRNRLLLAALFLLPAPAAAADEFPSLPTAEEIVARMGIQDLQRQVSIEGYAGMRRYVLDNQHLHKRAEMLVQVQGDPDGTKHFEVVSEEGWKAAHKHVLRKMLESESETSHPEARAKTRINPENYDFKMAGTDVIDGRTAYVLEVSPKRKEISITHPRRCTPPTTPSCLQRRCRSNEKHNDLPVHRGGTFFAKNTDSLRCAGHDAPLPRTL